MTPLQASRTALATSLMRAVHSRHDPAPLLDDDWGDRLVPEAARSAFGAQAQAATSAQDGSTDASPETALADALRANAAYADVILRSRYAEDALAAAVAGGTRQYGLIGAGFDSFAWRRPSWATGLRICEIDHPATQSLKQQRLVACAAQSPTEVDFVAADLAAEPLASALERSALARAEPTFFSWLGVTVYLTREANLATLRAIAEQAAPGSELVFTYVDERFLAGSPSQPEAFTRLQAKVSSIGEAFLSGFDPTTLPALLAEIGLTVLEDLDGEQLLARYDPEGRNALRAAAAAHIAHVRVAARGGAPRPAD